LKKLHQMMFKYALALSLLFPGIAFGADGGLSIPRIPTEPQFFDFEGMRPQTDVARSMIKVENFIQRVPNNGQAATQRTEAYLAYDQDQLHVIFLAFDTEPARVRANMSSRENIDGDDHVTIIIDTFNDQRAAF